MRTGSEKRVTSFNYKRIETGGEKSLLNFVPTYCKTSRKPRPESTPIPTSPVLTTTNRTKTPRDRRRKLPSLRRKLHSKVRPTLERSPLTPTSGEGKHTGPPLSYIYLSWKGTPQRTPFTTNKGELMRGILAGTVQITLVRRGTGFRPVSRAKTPENPQLHFHTKGKGSPGGREGKGLWWD